MDTHDFIGRYGGGYEHSPWVASEVAAFAADVDDVQTLAALMADCVDNAAAEQQLALIRAHPEYANALREFGNNESCMVVNADTLTNIDFESFISRYNGKKAA